ncbi:DUF420 domain-containing protein [Candidatus Zixiibacteriota bacterium]
MNQSILPTINVCLNLISLIFLILGIINIKRNNETTHKKMMLGAVAASFLFFITYTFYHYQVGSVPYPYNDWTRSLYYAILTPHVILSSIAWPFIIYILILAFNARFEKHRKIARFIWPVWIFNALSGITVYTMLYII